MSTEDAAAMIDAERVVRDRYLGEETGLRSAVFETLRRLYALPRLPANPYFFVATQLSAHSKHSAHAVWAQADATVYDWLEEVTLVEGGDGYTCKLAGFSDAWGLPHVLRAADREGLTDIKALLRKFPPELYPSPTPVVDPDNANSTRWSLMSLHEGCLHRRAWHGAPARLGLRYDVLVEAPDLQQASQTFVDYIYGVAAATATAEGGALRGVLLSPGGVTRSWADEHSSKKRAQWWSSEKIQADRAGFETAVIRATTSHHKVALEVTVRSAVPPKMLDGGYGTAAAAAAERGVNAMVTHFSVRVYFCLHFRSNSIAGRRNVAAEHYGTLPFEALYTGLFLEQEAAASYCEMFGVAVTPTSPMVLKNNTERLVSIGLHALRRDNLSRSLRVAMLVLLLRGDVGWRGEDEAPELGSDEEARESAFLDLMRMANASAVWLANLAEEAQVLQRLFHGPWAIPQSPSNAAALTSQLSHLNRRLDDFMRAAARRDYGLEPLRELASQALRGATRRCGRGGAALAAPASAGGASYAAAKALATARLLTAVVAMSRQNEVHLMRPRAALLEAAALGIDLVDRDGHRRVEDDDLAEAGADEPVGTIGEEGKGKRKKKKKKKKKSMRSVFAFGTLKSGRKDKDGAEKSGTSGIDRLDNIPLVDPRVPPPTMKELDVVWQRVYEVVAPDACVYLRAGEHWLRKHRYVPPRFNTAALLLQYVVDSRLDETLQEILTEVSQPPLVSNPYPAVVERLRSAGHQADVSLHLDGSGRDYDGNGGTAGIKSKASPRQPPLRGVAAARPKITMVQPPDPVYAARPPPGSSGAASGAVVFGIYSAVAFADPVRLCRLRDELPDLLRGRNWQDGSFQYECLSAFGGDAAFTAALGPMLEEEPTAPGKGGKEKTKKGRRASAKAPRLNSLGFTPVVEERTRVTGPDRIKAADIYGADVVRRLVEIQEETSWLVHNITVPRGIVAAAGAAAAAKQQQEAERRVVGSRVGGAGGEQAAGEVPPRSDSVSSAAVALVAARRMLGSGAVGDAAEETKNVKGGRGAPSRLQGSRPVTSDPERLAELQQLVIKQKKAEEARRHVQASGVGGALGQNAMRESDVIRITWDELRSNQRDAAKIISRVVQQGGEACAQISVKFQGKYLPVFINYRLSFQRGTKNSSRLGVAGEGEEGTMEEDSEEGGWPLDAYTMVFGSRRDALAWTKWYADRGDPASPAAVRVAAAAFANEEINLVDQSDYLAAIRCRVGRALILQEHAGRVALVASCLMGAPMVTQCLQDANSMLQSLVGAADAPEALLVKIDTRGAREALLNYLDVTERVLTSPTLSYFLGANRMMRKSLAEIRAADLASGGMLGPEPLDRLQEVHTWLAVSEVCITRGLYRLIKEQDAKAEVKRRQMEQKAAERAKERQLWIARQARAKSAAAK